MSKSKWVKITIQVVRPFGKQLRKLDKSDLRAPSTPPLPLPSLRGLGGDFCPSHIPKELSCAYRRQRDLFSRPIG